jgi:hypothetical protein
MHLLDELAGMFGKLPDRLNAAAKRPSEYAAIQSSERSTHNPFAVSSLDAIL